MQLFVLDLRGQGAVLKPEEEKALEHQKESRDYTCGAVLFPVNSPYRDAIVTRYSLNCSSPMEVAYNQLSELLWIHFVTTVAVLRAWNWRMMMKFIH